jgi:hypothetical protein
MNQYNWISKLILSFRWVAIRNSHWNLKLMLKPKQGKLENLKIITNTTKKDGTVFCNYTIFGKQYCTYDVGGVSYFRYSFTKKVGKSIWNVMLGTSTARYIYKSRFKKIN